MDVIVALLIPSLIDASLLVTSMTTQVTRIDHFQYNFKSVEVTHTDARIGDLDPAHDRW